MKTLGGSLLVAGTTIGAGMLALPLVTAEAGFFPAFCLFLLYGAFSLITALFLLEVTLAFDHPVNFVTMSYKTLGAPGRLIAWGIYLLLLYCLTAAYIAGSAAFLPLEQGPYLFLLLFGTLLFFKTALVDHINRYLMVGLILSYLLLVGYEMPALSLARLQQSSWSTLLPAVPIVVTAFGFQIIVPTLVTYMHRDVAKIKRAIFLGGVMAFLFYILFEAVMLGSIPLETIQKLREEGTALHDSGIVRAFSFFAITTSFLGVSLCLRDFLADGLKMVSSRWLLTLLTYLPPLIFVFFYPKAFLRALDFAGLFVALLLGLWPALMVLRKRQLKWSSSYRVAGGFWLLAATALVYGLVVVQEFLERVVL